MPRVEYPCGFVKGVRDRFRSVDDLILSGVQAWRERNAVAPAAEAPKKNVVEFFRTSPLVGLELDFERDRDAGRDIEL